jgi:hypothetical protein
MNKIGQAINRMNQGVYGPSQSNWATNTSPNIIVREFVIIGNDPYTAYCIPYYLVKNILPKDILNWYDVNLPPLIAVQKPINLDHDAGPNSQIVPADGGGTYWFNYTPPYESGISTFDFWETYSNWSSDGNFRTATNNTNNNTYQQMIDPPYQTGYPLYAAFLGINSLFFTNFGNNGAFDNQMSTVQYLGDDTHIVLRALPSEQIGDPIFFADLNLDSRHWIPVNRGPILATILSIAGQPNGTYLATIGTAPNTQTITVKMPPLLYTPSRTIPGGTVTYTYTWANSGSSRVGVSTVSGATTPETEVLVPDLQIGEQVYVQQLTDGTFIDMNVSAHNWSWQGD